MICEIKITQAGLKQALQEWLDKRYSEAYQAGNQIDTISLQESFSNTTVIASDDKIVLTLKDRK